MSSPGTSAPTNLPQDQPLELTHQNLRSLETRLDQWFEDIFPGKPRPEKIRISKDSAYRVRATVNEFLSTIEYVTTMELYEKGPTH